MSIDLFCCENAVPISRVDRKVFDELVSLKTVSDVLRSSLFGRENKQTLLKLYKKVEMTDVERFWLVSSTTRPLLKYRNESPLYLMHFMVTSKGNIQFQTKINLLHSLI